MEATGSSEKFVN